MPKTSPSVALEKIEGWDLLEQAEVQTVLANDEIAVEARKGELGNALTFGRALREIRTVLEPKRGLWMAYLKHRFHMSIPTAYRYISKVEKTEAKLPKPVMNLALKLGYDIDPKAIENTRPPQTTDHDEIKRYLDRVTLIRPRATVSEKSTDDVLKEWLNSVILGWNKLPQNARTRANVLRTFQGMLLTQFGISNPITIEPVAIPDHLRVYRGRPSLERMKRANVA